MSAKTIIGTYTAAFPDSTASKIALTGGGNLRCSIRRTRPMVSVTNSLARVELVIAGEFLFYMCFFVPTQLAQLLAQQGMLDLLLKGLWLEYPFAHKVNKIRNLSQDFWR